MTLEQKAWQLHKNGVSYGELASFANIFECTMNEAVEELWQIKLNGKPFNTQFRGCRDS